MKKVDISDIPLRTDVNSLTRLIGFDPSGLVSSQRVIGDVSAEGSPIADANLLHTTQGKGLSILPTAVNTLNVPQTSGMIIHIQRAPKDNTSSSQIILQAHFGNANVQIRVGRGDTSGITYAPWRII